MCRIALANLRFPGGIQAATSLAVDAIERASAARARVLCFPECFLPGLRGVGHVLAPPDGGSLDRAWSAVGAAAGRFGVGVILGTERVVEGSLLISAMVFGADGAAMGVQDKVQIDPSEEGIYTAGSGRSVFEIEGLRFGVAICHEGWRYPETVRWAAWRGAQLVFVPHYSECVDGAFRPTSYADPLNTFHEKALLCRAAENTCYVASANYASDGSPTTSAVVRPDGTLQCFQPYGVEGLLVTDLDLSLATGLLARRCLTAVW